MKVKINFIKMVEKYLLKDNSNFLKNLKNLFVFN